MSRSPVILIQIVILGSVLTGAYFAGAPAFFPFLCVLVSLLFFLDIAGKPLFQPTRNHFYKPNRPIRVKVENGILSYGLKIKSKLHGHLDWELKLDDVRVITASSPDSFILKKGDPFWQVNQEGRQRRVTGSEKIEGYTYLHFFDRSKNQFILNLFSHPEGMGEVFSELESRFGVNRKTTEDIENESQILYPKGKRFFIPHGEPWMGSIQSFKKRIHSLFKFSHPHKAILREEVWTFAKEERLLQEIGKE